MADRNSFPLLLVDGDSGTLLLVDKDNVILLLVDKDSINLLLVDKDSITLLLVDEDGPVWYPDSVSTSSVYKHTETFDAVIDELKQVFGIKLI